MIERKIAVKEMMKGKVKSIASILMIFEMMPILKREIKDCFGLLCLKGNVFAEVHV